MFAMTRSFVCLVGILTMACGGGGDGKCGPTDPGCGPPPPPPVDVCPNIGGNQATVPEGMIKNSAGECVNAPPNNTRDTIMPVFAPADSFDVAPVGVFVDFISTDSVSAPYSAWYVGTGLSVPKGASGRLCIRGGEKYESRCWNITASSGARFAAVLHPKCWSIRMGRFAGSTKCLSSTDLKAVVGGGDGASFYHQWVGPASLFPWGLAESHLPVKVKLADPYSAGENWSASDSALIASQIEVVNQDWGRQVLVMAGRTNDTLPAVGSITVMRKADNSLTNHGLPLGLSGVAGEFNSGRVIMAKGGLAGERNVANVSHEFLHVLGFGHTDRWVTHMYSLATEASKAKVAPDYKFTAEDVTGFQLAYAIREQAKRININLSWF